ncbi:A kinase Mark2PAR-1 mutant, partial [Chytriomyces sp. MP71]
MSVVPAPLPHTDQPAGQGPAPAPLPGPGHSEKHEEKHKYIGNYEILKTIGEGSFARVKLAIHRLTKQKVALKIIDKERLPDEYSLKNIHREAQIMRLLDHPHIIQLYEVMETKKELFLVLEYAVGGELLDYIVSRGRLHEKEARKFFGQIVSALEYCHTLNIVHRDLKAENLLLDENSQIKISDFGLSNVFDRSKTLVTCCGSPVYSAPELIEGRKYTGPEVDCWSLGINLYAMVIGDLPFADSNLTALYNSILKGVYHVPDYVSADCKDLISRLLERNPEKRYTITQVRDHVWLTHGMTLLEPSTNVATDVRQRTRPRTDTDLDAELLDQLVLMGFERGTAVASVVGGKFNQAAGTYYLMAAQK